MTARSLLDGIGRWEFSWDLANSLIRFGVPDGI